MKVGICAKILDNRGGFDRYGDERYKKIRSFGYEALDISIGDTDSPLYTQPFEKAREILLHSKKLIEEAGLEISQTHGPWRWPCKDYTEEDRAERLEKMQYGIRLSKVLGCKHFVIHPIMPYGVEDIEKGYAEDTWRLNLEFFRKLLVTAKENDVIICLENMPMLKFSMSTPEQILKFVKEINDDNFKICLDTGHTAVFYELDIAEEVKRLGDELRVLHVHDSRYRIDAHLLPYFGRIDWNSFGAALKDIGYNGVISLETVPPKILPDELFEELNVTLCKLAANICKDL